MPKKAEHGHNKTSRTYRIWRNMLTRCRNPNHKDYAYYGARGIRVCADWYVFSNFLRDMGVCPDNLTLDRVDSDGDYTPGNCRWSTRLEQVRNRRQSPTTGVRERSGKFYARICVSGKDIHIGTFSSLADAQEARSRKKLEVGYAATK